VYFGKTMGFVEETNMAPGMPMEGRGYTALGGVLASQMLRVARAQCAGNDDDQAIEL
jgi:hypothetical protein